jgi:hypothetical protein
MYESDNIIIQSPTSFVGSARRIWKLTRLGHPALKVLAVPTALLLTGVAWVFCAVWLLLFGVLLLPWRLLRRGARKRKQEAMRHAEMMAAVLGQK